MLFLLFCDNKKKKFRIWYLVFSHRLVQWKKHLFSLERFQNLGHCELFGVIGWVMDIFVAGNFSILFVCRPVCLPVHSGFLYNLINNLQGRRTQELGGGSGQVGGGDCPIWSHKQGNLVFLKLLSLMRKGRGSKNVRFCTHSGIKTVHAGKGGQKWQNSVHVVVESPLEYANLIHFITFFM